MRVRPTLGTGRQGWERLMGSRAAGLPSQRPGKQEEKVAKPPAGGAEEMRVRGWAGWGRRARPPTHQRGSAAPTRTPSPSWCWPASLWPEHLVSVLVPEGQSRGRGPAHLHHLPLR